MYPKHEVEEIVFAEFVAVTGAVIAGVGLSLFIHKILAQPGLFILLPGLLAMRGNISGTAAARLSEALHLHRLSHWSKHSRIINDNVLASFFLTLISSVVLGIVAFFSAKLFFGIYNPSIILIALLAGIISSIILLPLITGAVFWLFKHNLDPDDIMGPYVTMLGDIVMVGSLFIAVVIV